MSILKTYDETIHDEDEYETPYIVYMKLVEKYQIFPKLDVCATRDNRKCLGFFDKELDALIREWKEDVWCNPPHSRTISFVRKAQGEWDKNNINILMIVPANAIGAHFFDPIFDNDCATYHRYSGRIRFLQHGKPAPQSSRNGYFVVLWRKRNGRG